MAPSREKTGGAFKSAALTADAKRKSLVEPVASLEHINAAARINQLLLTRKERVAFRADFDVDVFLC
jgi:hypothetical protein